MNEEDRTNIGDEEEDMMRKKHFSSSVCSIHHESCNSNIEQKFLRVGKFFESFVPKPNEKQ